jgi:hypothetical protein
MNFVADLLWLFRSFYRFRNVLAHAVFHFVPPLEIHNLYFGKNDKGDKSYKFMLQVANFYIAPSYEN